MGVLHSGLTAAQRRREYDRIAEARREWSWARGRRCSLPSSDLRLVIIDESHDASYKQEEAPGYHAKTVAELRLEGSGGLLLEGSASPAVESMADPDDCIRLARAGPEGRCLSAKWWTCATKRAAAYLRPPPARP